MTVEAVCKEEQGACVSRRLKAAFILALGGLLTVVRTILLPHLAASLVLFVLAFYAAYTRWLALLPEPFCWVAAFFVFGAYGTLALAYALTASLVFALRSAAVNVEDFLYALFASVKDGVRAKIDNMEEGVARRQARLILDNSVREALAPLKSFRFNTAPALAAGIFVSLLTLVTRSVFLARLARLSGATVNFSAVFAGRATLVGALILNFRWLAVLALWVLYGAWGAVFIFNVWLVW